MVPEVPDVQLSQASVTVAVEQPFFVCVVAVTVHPDTTDDFVFLQDVVPEPVIQVAQNSVAVAGEQELLDECVDDFVDFLEDCSVDSLDEVFLVESLDDLSASASSSASDSNSGVPSGRIVNFGIFGNFRPVMPLQNS